MTAQEREQRIRKTEEELSELKGPLNHGSPCHRFPDAGNRGRPNLPSYRARRSE